MRQYICPLCGTIWSHLPDVDPDVGAPICNVCDGADYAGYRKVHAAQLNRLVADAGRKAPKRRKTRKESKR